MEPFDWKAFLTTWMQELLRREGDVPGIHPQVRATNWLGFPGASEAQFQDAERRLGVSLPPSYRAFLRTTNGWRQIRDWVPTSAGHLLPVEGIDWFAVREKDWLDTWMTGVRSYGGPFHIPDNEYFVYGPGQDSCKFRDEYLAASLAISTEGDGAIYLLNPKVLTREGEWEAWFFSNWAAGASRYRSFQEMMPNRHRMFVESADARHF